jgi:hypothetical protein
MIKRDFYKNVCPKTKMSKFEAHSFYKVMSWMTFTVTHDYPRNPTEQSTHGPLHSYSMMLIASWNLFQSHVWNIYGQALQILFHHLIILSILQRCRYPSSSLDGRSTRRSVRSNICDINKRFCISLWTYKKQTFEYDKNSQNI